jgi:hypothetical protein
LLTIGFNDIMVAQKTAKLADCGYPSLTNIKTEQQLDAIQTILNYVSKDAMHDFFRLNNADIQMDVFPPEMLVKVGAFGYMFVEPSQTVNVRFRDWVKSINYNIEKPLMQLIGTIVIAKPNKVLQGGKNGITTYLFTTYQKQMDTIIKNAVAFTFNELNKKKDCKYFYPMVSTYSIPDMEKDSSPYWESFIKKQLRTRFEMEEFLLRDNPAVANNINTMLIFGR